MNIPSQQGNGRWRTYSWLAAIVLGVLALLLAK